jgi:hypothetical protein
MIFCIVSTQSNKKKEGKERKKNRKEKAFLG